MRKRRLRESHSGCSKVSVKQRLRLRELPERLPILPHERMCKIPPQRKFNQATRLQFPQLAFGIDDSLSVPKLTAVLQLLSRARRIRRRRSPGCFSLRKRRATAVADALQPETPISQWMGEKRAEEKAWKKAGGRGKIVVLSGRTGRRPVVVILLKFWYGESHGHATFCSTCFRKISADPKPFTLALLGLYRIRHDKG